MRGPRLEPTKTGEIWFTATQENIYRTTLWATTRLRERHAPSIRCPTSSSCTTCRTGSASSCRAPAAPTSCFAAGERTGQGLHLAGVHDGVRHLARRADRCSSSTAGRRIRASAPGCGRSTAGMPCASRTAIQASSRRTADGWSRPAAVCPARLSSRSCRRPAAASADHAHAGRRTRTHVCRRRHAPLRAHPGGPARGVADERPMASEARRSASRTASGRPRTRPAARFLCLGGAPAAIAARVSDGGRRRPEPFYELPLAARSSTRDGTIRERRSSPSTERPAVPDARQRERRARARSETIPLVRRQATGTLLTAAMSSDATIQAYSIGHYSSRLYLGRGL